MERGALPTRHQHGRVAPLHDASWAFRSQVELRAQVAVKRIRALIVHAKPEIRSALRDMLAGETDIELLGEFTDGRSGSAAVRNFHPQLLFLGVRFKGMDGFDLLK